MKVTSRYRLSIRNFRERKTFKHTVNVNELGTYALTGSCRFRICIFSG